ncbi:response regulator [Catenuloplanes japonicus]|uniref:response regulator n=1 Tax=Catenuloplanes japonicus TaxID=33876 RepID=UPI0005249EAE|nr:response regulator transcription factor [Catenuloplanes japonicus]
MRVLVAEDEPRLAQLLQRGLTEEGHVVDVTGHGDEAAWMAAEAPYDVIVLDVMLPGRDGLRITRDLRTSGRTTPVLLLTARDAVPDRVAGLDAGADDYLTKPFSFAELAARVRALGRRGTGAPDPELRVADLRLDPVRRRAWRGGTELDLSARELALLEIFMQHPDQVLSRTVIRERLWNLESDPVSNVIDQHVAALRRKIDHPFGRANLRTVRGAGYRLHPDG